MPDLGIVIIGRNEGVRLRASLASIPPGVPAVYVDSASTDGSVKTAQAAGASVVELDMARPFSAARARNEGFDRLLQLAADVAFVQFIDGDCEIVPGWLDAGRAALLADDKLAVACGRRRERYSERSIYNQLCDMEWDTPVGLANACGGDAMMRVAAFRQVGGYDPAVIAGEEPELCVRLRSAGWTIRRLDAEMTRHDAAMTRFGQWWKRNVRAGHAYAQGYAMHGRPPERFRRKEVVSNAVYGLLLPLALVAVEAVLLLIALLAPAARTLAFALVAAVAAAWVGMYALLAWKICRHRLGRGESPPLAALYAGAVVAGKFPQALGQVKFWTNQLRGRQARIIEYKSATTAPQPAGPA